MHICFLLFYYNRARICEWLLGLIILYPGLGLALHLVQCTHTFHGVLGKAGKDFENRKMEFSNV